MPVTEDYEPKTFNCDGSQTEFSVSFRINETSDAKVYLRDTEIADPNDGQTLLAEETHYSISAPNNEYGDGFKVTTVATYANTYKLIVARDLAETQTASYIENDSFPSKSHENVVDKLCMLVQELKAINPRLLKLAITSAYSDLTLPDPIASNLLAWKDDLSGIKNVKLAENITLVSDFMETLLDDANAGAALTTLGFSTFIKTLINDTDAATFLTTLGLDNDLLTLLIPANTTISAFIKTLLDDADAATFLTTLGLDNDLLTLLIPANTTISAFIKTLLDDADAATARATLEVSSGGIVADEVKDYNVDWGSGANQVDLDDVPDGTYQKVHGDYVDANGKIDSVKEVNGERLIPKVIDIGDWNMHNSNSGSVLKSVAHGLGALWRDIRSINVTIRDDGDSVLYLLNNFNDQADPYLLNGGIAGINSTNVLLRSRTGGTFDTVAFDSTSYNRGWVTIWHKA